MYKAYSYTSKFGLMSKQDYVYTGRESGKCQYQSEKVVFKNAGMVQEHEMSNNALKARVAQ